MSYEVENWVRHNTPVKLLGPRFLLMTMANMADAEGYLWGTNEHFASVLGVTVRAIQKYSSLLEAEGAIEKLPQVAKNGRTMNNAYRIITPGRAIVQVRSKEPGRVNGRSSSPPEQVDTLPLNACSSSPCTPVHPHRETVPQKPPTETTTAPPTPLGSKAINSVQEVPWEDVEALRQNITEISERSGVGFDTVCLRVTSGATTRKSARCLPTLNLDRMSREHVRRSLADTRTELERLREGALA